MTCEVRSHVLMLPTYILVNKMLFISASQAKGTWGKLRNCFSNALKRRNAHKSGQAAKKYIPWKYEMQMAFLQPYMDSRQTHSNLSQAENASQYLQLPEEEFQIIEDSELENTEEHEGNERETGDILSVSSHSTNAENTSQSLPRNQQTPQRKKRPNPADEIVQIMKKKLELRIQKVSQRPENSPLLNNLNETDMFYLSMSKTVQKLPPLEQVHIRMELCRLVSEAEMSQLKSLNDN
ncbi:unnamed protein product [Ceutorhynchus assimilis]|uniref:BESS domain-containing protein n=1 Tax=Ceutorhynchus assimilis TaxID=467358 RepID=A0A9N9QL47_9CUCU|nr:unnamed protein product [Ceutorhynchus assimilis]